MAGQDQQNQTSRQGRRPGFRPAALIRPLGGVRTAIGSGTAGFARQLIERHGAVHLRLPALDLLLPPVVASSMVQQITPRLELHVHNRLVDQRAYEIKPGEVGQTAPTRPSDTARQVEQLLVHHSTRLEHFTEQLVTRLERVEQGSAAALAAQPAEPAGAGTRLRFSPVPMEVAPAPRAQAGAQETEPAPRRGSVEGEPPATSRGRAVNSPPAAPVVDIRQVTDQVLQALDRRLLAERERMGRMGL